MQSGSNDTAIVLRGGSNAELNSVLDRDSVDVITEAPGVARDAQGRPIASPELSVVANLPKKSEPSVDANVQIRGVGPQAWALRPKVKIIAGRRFKPGLRELVVGQGAARQFAGLEVGHTITTGRSAVDRGRRTSPAAIRTTRSCGAMPARWPRPTAAARPCSRSPCA